MIAINNAALISPSSGIGIPPVDETLFVPAATFSYNAGAKTLTVTDATTITSPDTFSKGNVQIVDNQGGTVYGHISAAAGNTGALSVAGLVLSGPLTLVVTLVSTKGVQCTGTVNYINASNASGSVGDWEINYTTAA
jgi:hypothetical protein